MSRLGLTALLTIGLTGAVLSPATADAGKPHPDAAVVITSQAAMMPKARRDAAIAISVPAENSSLADRLAASLPGAEAAHAQQVTASTQRFVHQALAMRAAADRVSRSRPGFAMYVPAYGRISASFGSSSGLWWNKHTGMDIRAHYGDRVRNVVAGTVIKVAYNRFYGRTIVVRGRGVDIWYAHLSKTYVKSGQVVKAGKLIGRVGCTGHCTGAHLHVEVRKHDLPTNPATYLWGSHRGKPGDSPAWAHVRISRLSDL